MFRKTLTILSLIGLLLSMGLWGVSYFYSLSYLSESYGFGVQRHSVIIGKYPRGRLSAQNKGWQWQKQDIRWFHFEMLRYDSHQSWGGLWWIVTLPLWISTLLFAVLFLSFRPLHFRRRRKRKKLGLCIKCGYDLRASKDRCPECGHEFESHD